MNTGRIFLPQRGGVNGRLMFPKKKGEKEEKRKREKTHSSRQQFICSLKYLIPVIVAAVHTNIDQYFRRIANASASFECRLYSRTEAFDSPLCILKQWKRIWEANQEGRYPHQSLSLIHLKMLSMELVLD